MKLRYLALASGALLCASAAQAGPFIIDGTDADDHGFVSAGSNQDGWLYIQRGLENIGTSSGLTNTNKRIAVLGSDIGGTAAQAVQSALALSSTLQSAGWALDLLNGAQISAFFANGGSGYSVIYMDSTANNVGGGLNSAEQAILDANATAINAFVGNGGGLFSHSQGYGWLSALIPGLAVVNSGDTGITLTAAGQANFPGLTNADLSSGPWHNYFTNTGQVPVLGVGNGNRAVILGGSGGSITDPTPAGGVPEPTTWVMMIAGFGLVGGAMRRRSTKVAFAA